MMYKLYCFSLIIDFYNNNFFFFFMAENACQLLYNRKISRHENFANLGHRQFRDRKISRIWSQRTFLALNSKTDWKLRTREKYSRAGKFRENRDIRENREIFLHANVCCYTVFSMPFLKVRFILLPLKHTLLRLAPHQCICKHQYTHSLY